MMLLLVHTEMAPAPWLLGVHSHLLAPTFGLFSPTCFLSVTLVPCPARHWRWGCTRRDLHPEVLRGMLRWPSYILGWPNWGCCMGCGGRVGQAAGALRGRQLTHHIVQNPRAKKGPWSCLSPGSLVFSHTNRQELQPNPRHSTTPFSVFDAPISCC